MVYESSSEYPQSSPRRIASGPFWLLAQKNVPIEKRSPSFLVDMKCAYRFLQLPLLYICVSKAGWFRGERQRGKFTEMAQVAFMLFPPDASF